MPKEKTKTAGKTLILVADPMCSWCWGFVPAMHQIRADYADRLGLTVIAGGLRPGTTEPMDDAMKVSIRKHWEHVHEASGQPFNFNFFERDGFVYDTEPSCRAVVVARSMDQSRALDMLDALHKANYADNRDITDPAVLADIAAEQGYERAAFADALTSDAARAATVNDFQAARSLGVTGFPTLLARQTDDAGEEQYGLLTAGYRPYDALKPLLEQWVTST